MDEELSFREVGSDSNDMPLTTTQTSSYQKTPNDNLKNR